MLLSGATSLLTTFANIVCTHWYSNKSLTYSYVLQDPCGQHFALKDMSCPWQFADKSVATPFELLISTMYECTHTSFIDILQLLEPLYII